MARLSVEVSHKIIQFITHLDHPVQGPRPMYYAHLDRHNLDKEHKKDVAIESRLR